MGRRRRSEKGSCTPLVCLECGVDMAARPPERNDTPAGPGLWTKGPVVHCKGSFVSFNSRWKEQDHHGHQRYTCRKCKRDLGCDYCAQRPSELICTACHDWAMIEGLREHGPMVPRERAVGMVKDLLRKL